MNRSTIQKEYSLEDAPEALKEIIMLAQTGERSELIDGNTYALYSEAPSGRRYVMPAEYNSEDDAILPEGILTYDPDNRKVRVRESSKYLENCGMVPTEVFSGDFEKVKELLESY